MLTADAKKKKYIYILVLSTDEVSHKGYNKMFTADPRN
jgi:hypothetical protein